MAREVRQQRLARLKRTHPEARLADAQRAVAREYGFPSWRRLEAHVEATASAPAGDGVRDDEHDSTPLGWAATAIEVTRNPACAALAAYLESLAPS